MNTLDLTHLIAIAAALGWASGLRLYAVLFLTGTAGRLGLVSLPQGLLVLQQPMVLWASGAMLAIEFVVDKVPWLDSLWDAVHTLVRIPAGALLAAGAHAAKATTRAAANTSPEPFSNIGLSLLGDVAVPGMLWLSWTHPVAFFVALALAVVTGLVIVVVLFRFLRGLFQRLAPPRLPAA